MVRSIFIFIVFLFLASKANAKDPTKPLVSTPKIESEKTIRTVNKQPLTAIILNNGRYKAIINGQMLQEGKEADGLKVIKIERTRVLVQSTKGNQWLTLIPKIKK